MALDKKTLDKIVKKATTLKEKAPNLLKPQHKYVADDVDDVEEYVPIGIKGITAASEKLLAINRQLDTPDDRDNIQFKRVYTTDKLMKERVRMDAEQLRRNAMRHITKHRNLKHVMPFFLDRYTEGHIVGNSLSQPLEEINPVQLMEQGRRVTQFGPGGINSDDAITQEMQGVQANQFGFISPLEGPESSPPDTEIFTKRGWVFAPDLTDQDEFACNINGKLEFHKPIKLFSYPYKGELIGINSLHLKFLVTPEHRLYCRSKYTKDSLYRFEFAKAAYDKHLKFNCVPGIYEGIDNTKHDYPDQSVNIGGLAEFLAWYLAEGSLGGNTVRITKTLRHKPKDVAHLTEFLPKVFGKAWAYKVEEDFVLNDKELATYVKQFGASGTKYIPEWVFDTSVEVRTRMLDVFMRTDARVNKTHKSYCSTSIRLSKDVERLMISLGYPTSFREEKDYRPHVKSRNWLANILSTKERYSRAGLPTENYWFKEDYDGLVYCATVPGSLMFIKRGTGVGHWSGNSGRAGIDNRFAWGTKIGNNGKVYQRFFNRHTGKIHWMSPEEVVPLTVKIPD